MDRRRKLKIKYHKLSNRICISLPSLTELNFSPKRFEEFKKKLNDFEIPNVPLKGGE